MAEDNFFTLEVTVRTQDLTRGELIDAIASGAKLTKADAGRAVREDHLTITIEPGTEGFVNPKIKVCADSKTAAE